MTEPKPVRYETCPNCQAEIPVYFGYKTWCDNCEWNLDIPDKFPYDSLIDKIGRRINKKAGDHLHAEILKNGLARPKVDFPLVLAYLISFIINGITLAFFIAGIFFTFFAFPQSRFLGIVLGCFCFLFGLFLRPRFDEPVWYPFQQQNFSTLYKITNWLTGELGAPAVNHIKFDLNYSAFVTVRGWNNQRILLLGLPLISVLSSEEKLALMAHELAHFERGDPSRSLFIVAALKSLSTWYEIIHPGNRHLAMAGIPGPLLLILYVIGLPVAGLIWITGYLLSQLLLYHSRQSEYYADLTAAKISGTEVFISMISKASLFELYNKNLVYFYIRKKGASFYEDLRLSVSNIPEREFLRLRRIESRIHSSIGTTHPTHEQRIEFLRYNYNKNGTLHISVHEMQQLEDELNPLFKEMQKKAFELDELSFREYFHVNW